MKFFKETSNDKIVGFLAGLINNQLAKGQKVLWLVPGGSAMKVAAEVVKQLPPPLQRLTISLTDERYGPLGHSDSNWRQLTELGFAASGATTQPVLSGKNLAETAKDYSATLMADLKTADYSLALAGMGPDGHIFGIKPGSPSVAGNKEVVGYEWNDYARITPTIKLIKQLDEVIIYAMGSEKWPQLDALDKELDVNKQPAQLLKQLPRVIIINDYKGESL